jgi:hypothetical protein
VPNLPLRSEAKSWNLRQTSPLLTYYALPAKNLCLCSVAMTYQPLSVQTFWPSFDLIFFQAGNGTLCVIHLVAVGSTIEPHICMRFFFLASELAAYSCYTESASTTTASEVRMPGSSLLLKSPCSSICTRKSTWQSEWAGSGN